MSPIEAGIPSRECPIFHALGKPQGQPRVLSEHPSSHRNDLGLDFSAKLRLQAHRPPVRLDSRAQACIQSPGYSSILQSWEQDTLKSQSNNKAPG